MAAIRIPDTVRRIFTDTFTVRDIAEPLASFDAATPAQVVRDFMQTRDFDVVGIRSDGQVVGYVEKEWLQEGACGQFQRGFAQAIVLEDTTPLLRVLMTLNETWFGFVNLLGMVGGIITRADLQKPPVRMWLFGIVTLIELRYSQFIEQRCPGDSWKAFLSEARLEKARLLLEERRRRNQALELVDCLQFSDKGTIIARNEEIRKHTIFASRRQAEQAIKQLEQLRNNLAHAQDILSGDQETIVQLCELIANA